MPGTHERLPDGNAIARQVRQVRKEGSQSIDAGYHITDGPEGKDGETVRFQMSSGDRKEQSKSAHHAHHSRANRWRNKEMHTE